MDKKQSEVKNEKSVFATVMTVILMIVVVLSVSIVVYKSFKSDNSSGNEQEKETIKEYLDSPINLNNEQKMFFDIISEIGVLPSFEKKNNIVSINTQNIPNNEKLLFALRHIDSDLDYISATDVGNTLRNYFGSDITVIHNDVVCDSLPTADSIQNHIAYTYDSTLAAYSISASENHEIYKVNYFYFINDVELLNDTYVISMNILKTKPYIGDEPIKALYDDLYDEPVLRTNKLGGFNPENYINTIGLYFNNIDKELTTYKYVFEKENDNYVLISYEY